MREVVLVTGGSGLLGHGICDSLRTVPRPINLEMEYEWKFLASTDCDLRCKQSTMKLFKEMKPKFVIHCAACVGGLFKNSNNKLKMYQDNIDINRNVLAACHHVKVSKLVSVLTTCIFPNCIETYPFESSELHNGPPHPSNEGYAYAKRMLEVESRLYREQYGCNYVCAVPTNIYGKNDNFHLEDGHVVPCLIHKTFLASKSSKVLTVLGSGSPLRQFVYSVDVGTILIWMLFNYDEVSPLIITSDEEISINELATEIIKACGGEIALKFDRSKADGQFKKTASNKQIKELLPDLKFTPLSQGLGVTCQWFQKNYPQIRK